MSDITKCQDKGCAQWTTCWRALAPSSQYWQSYFTHSPRKATGECEYYWPTSTQEDKEEGAKEECASKHDRTLQPAGNRHRVLNTVKIPYKSQRVKNYILHVVT